MSMCVSVFLFLSVFSSGICPKGYYCPEGTLNKFEHRCMAGRYGDSEGLTNSGCSGVCSAGYYCPEQSTSPTQVQCGFLFERLSAGDEHLDTVVTGKQLEMPNSVFCVEGSMIPLVAHPGFSTILGNLTTRESEVACPRGAYCQHGIVRDCPAGRYGITERLQTPDCSGLCQKGYYCPPGSTTRNEFPCPKGRYGDREGLTNLLCSGACQNPYYCPEGSTEASVKNTEKAGNIW